MAERRRSSDNGGQPDKLDRFRGHLIIDKDDLDNCLVEQPELFDHVADAYAVAKAERDATRLDIEEAEAEEAQKIRDRAIQMEEKVTEGSIKEQLILNTRLKKLRRVQLEQSAVMDRWGALKESYDHRKFMLKELAPMHVAKMFSSGNAVRINTSDVVSNRVKDQLDEERNRRGYKRDR